MQAIVIITNKIKFSNNVQEYFLSLSLINHNNIKIFCFGTDLNSKQEIIDKLNNEIILHKKIKNFFILADFGDPVNISKIIQNLNSKVFLSNGSLIEVGYLIYKLINGGSPIEAIMEIINKTNKIKLI